MSLWVKLTAAPPITASWCKSGSACAWSSASERSSEPCSLRVLLGTEPAVRILQRAVAATAFEVIDAAISGDLGAHVLAMNCAPSDELSQARACLAPARHTPSMFVQTNLI